MSSTGSQVAEPAGGEEGLPSPEPGVEEHYPNEGRYVLVALILAVVTAIEVAVYYVSAVKAALVPILIVLSAVKFSLVALFFMHLRYDSKIFRRLFVTGIMLAVAVYIIALSSLHVFSR